MRYSKKEKQIFEINSEYNRVLRLIRYCIIHLDLHILEIIIFEIYNFEKQVVNMNTRT